MRYLSNIKLSSTNPELISSGSTFYSNLHIPFTSTEDGKVFFTVWDDHVHERIINLSSQNPEETFITTWTWEIDDYDCTEYRGIYCNGRYSESKIQPGYRFCMPDFEMIDENLLEEFQKHVMTYVKRIDLIKDDPEKGVVFDFLNDQNLNNDGFNSFYQIVWENSEHRFIGTKRFLSHIDIKYERIEPKLNNFEESNNNSNNKINEEYNGLPF